MKRRDVLKLMGITTAGVAGTARAQSLFPYIDELGRVYPYVNEWERALPGLPNWYATTCRECPAGCGMLVKTRNGRAIKAEGNPDHPVNRGALCALGQASLEGLYHPDRYKGPLTRKDGVLKETTWEEAVASMALLLSDLHKKGKAGKVAFVTSSIGPSSKKVVDGFLRMMKAPPAIVYELLGYEDWKAANQDMFGMSEIPALRIDKADLIVSINSDFLEAGPSRVEHGKQLAEARRNWKGEDPRFIHFGPRVSMTAANADRWLHMEPGSDAMIANALYMAATGEKMMADAGADAEELQSVGEMIRKANSPLVIAGPIASAGGAELWKAVNGLNFLKGRSDTVVFGGGFGSDWSSYSELEELVEKMDRGEVEALFLWDVDMASLPLGARFERAASKTGMKVVFARTPNRSTEVADLVLPPHYFIETWDDYSPRAGVDGLVQPAMRPVYDTMHPAEVILRVASRIDGVDDESKKAGDKEEGQQDQGEAENKSEGKEKKPAAHYYDVLEKRWADKDWGGLTWFQVREKGGVWKEVAAKAARLESRAFLKAPSREKPESGIWFVPFSSPLLYDGRGEDRPWLREVADPTSRLAWDPWAEMHPDTAMKLRVSDGDLIKVETDSGIGEWPVLVREGIVKGCVAVPISPAFEKDGKVRGRVMKMVKAGNNGIKWLTSCQVKSAGEAWALPTVQPATSQHGRGIARDTTYHNPHHDREEWHHEHSAQHPPRQNMYKPHEYPLEGRGEHKWGMVVDLDRCIGCNACAVACYAENNLPVVGRELLLQRREMAWLRVERFYEERDGKLVTSFIPIMCQHCDNAPCESVCPVFATLHDPEGLNAQIYNRCVGTRFCSNNCPYKVRRFNWFEYQWEKPLHMQLNPEVTVREKGVMEKCTFCVQRIKNKKYEADLAGRKIEDGDVVPACAQTCPADAIVFGDLTDPESRVSKMVKDKRAYRILEQMNARPQVVYLKKVYRGPKKGE